MKKQLSGKSMNLMSSDEPVGVASAQPGPGDGRRGRRRLEAWVWGACGEARVLRAAARGVRWGTVDECTMADGRGPAGAGPYVSDGYGLKAPRDACLSQASPRSPPLRTRPIHPIQPSRMPGLRGVPVPSRASPRHPARAPDPLLARYPTPGPTLVRRTRQPPRLRPPRPQIRGSPSTRSPDGRSPPAIAPRGFRARRSRPPPAPPWRRSPTVWRYIPPMPAPRIA